MATNTTPVTGTVRTGMTGMRPPQPKQNPVARMLQWWAGLNAKQKTWVIVFAVLAVMASVGSLRYQKALAYVNLYENPLSPEDMQDVSTALAQGGINYGRTQDNHITVPPKKRVEALAMLTRQGIPRLHSYETPSEGSTKSHEEFTEQKRRILERDLTMVIRQLNGIADANVKLVIPPENIQFFGEDKEGSKAAVVIKMKPGYDKLPLPEAKAIVNLVASSVPGLKADKVELTDTNGRLLSQMIQKSENGLLSENQIELKKQMQEQLESQIRQVLDGALGRDKYVVSVNADIVFDQQERKERIVANPEMNPKGYIPSQQQHESEEYFKGGQSGGSGAKELAYATGSGFSGGNYKKERILTKNDANVTETRTIVTPGQVRRLTATVLADQTLPESTVRTITASIKGAVGFDQDRGDNVVFGTLPFHRNEIEAMSQEINGAGITRSGSGLPISGALWARMGMGAVVIAIVLASLVLFRQQKAQAEKTQLVLAAGPAATVSDISDLLNEKSGKLTTPVAGGLHQTQKLEQLVKEKPTKVAELLKTTWLAEK